MLTISPMTKADPPQIAAAFSAIGWSKPQAQYEQYLEEQSAEARSVLVARFDAAFAGYVTVLWRSLYAPFREAGTPEISDFNVLPVFRRRRIGTALMDAAEALIAERSETAGLGVGLYSDYGPAQRLYVLRGYVPDGRGVAWRHRTAAPMDEVAVDDDLVLFFTRKVR